MIEFQVFVNHAGGSKLGARMPVSKIGIMLAQSGVTHQLIQCAAKVPGIVTAEEHGRIIPKLAKGWNVTGDNCATGQRCLQRREAKWLVARRGGIDSRSGK